MYRREQALPWTIWYLDDGTIVGSLQAVGDYLEKLVPALEDIGLQVNPNKCTLWGPGARREDDMNDLIPDSWPLGHPLRAVPIVPYGPSQGITVLGVPCDAPNSTSHAIAHWDNCVQNTLVTLDRLRQLPDGQLRHCLIRYCLDACKVNHLMRSTPEACGRDSMKKLSDALKLALCDILGCGFTTVS